MTKVEIIYKVIFCCLNKYQIILTQQKNICGITDASIVPEMQDLLKTQIISHVMMLAIESANYKTNPYKSKQ